MTPALQRQELDQQLRLILAQLELVSSAPDDVLDRMARRWAPAKPAAELSTAVDHLTFWQQRSSPEGFVYFIQSRDDSGLVKIGRATNPIQRVSQLPTGSADELHLRHVVPGGAPLEAALHRRFAPARVRGEWFGAEYLPVVLAYAAGLAKDAIEADDGSGTAPWVTDKAPASYRRPTRDEAIRSRTAA